MNGQITQSTEYSNGVTLNVPGSGTQQILETPFGGQWPASATHVTTKNWYFTCGSASDGGQGFVGHAPNGDTYRFDKVVINRASDLGVVNGTNVTRNVYIIAATQVTDVNGNWVRYVYDTAGRLTRIHANDGRSITLAYAGASKLVASATANGRTWTYSYRASTHNFPTWVQFPTS